MTHKLNAIKALLPLIDLDGTLQAPLNDELEFKIIQVMHGLKASATPEEKLAIKQLINNLKEGK